MSKMIRGHGGGGGGSAPAQRTPVESPDSIRSKQYARVIDLLCEGEIEGLVDNLKSIYLDDTPIQNSDGSSNFPDITINTRNGTQNQTHIAGFPSVEAENNVGVEVKFGVPVVRQITNTNLNRTRVTLAIPALYQQQTNGDLTGATVDYAIDLQSNGGGFVEVLTTTISDKTSSRYQRSHDVTLIGSAPWDIRVRRITADSTSSSLQNKTVWESYTEIIDAKLTYPNSAIVGLEIDASQFSSIPARSYDVKLLKVRIPSNYDPIARTYTGLWNGTFTVAWTDNPAWCFYDIITNERYGLGSYIDSSLVDTAQLYQIAQYCDELVPDGFGGVEPRFTCNLYLQTREEAYRVVANMASIFTAMTYWSVGSIFAVQDSPQDVFAQFTNADVIGGEFNYSGSAGNARHSVALVTWNDPTDSYRQKIEYVEDAEAIARFGVRESEVVAIGCTSRGQAHRMGKLMLYTEKYETEVVTFKTSIKANFLAPGKIIQTMDATRAGVRFGGRILSGTTSSVVLDSSVTIGSGKTYNISLVLADGSIEERAVTNAVGGTSTITFSPVLPSAPQSYSIWILTASDLSAEKWRVMSVSEDNNIFTVNAVAHYDQKYAVIEQNLSFEEPDTTYLRFDYQAPVTDVVVTDSLYYLTQDVLGVKMVVSWQAPAGAVRYTVSYKTYNSPLQVASSFSPSVDILNIPEGEYTLSITAYNILGVPSMVVTQTYTVLGRFAVPSDVTGFSINTLGPTSYLSWDAALDLDLSHYQIRFSPATTGATWSSANVLVEKVGKPATSITVPTMVGTYLIKAVDYYDFYSENEALIISDIGGLEGFNVIELVQEQPDFLGVKDNTEMVGVTLQLSGDTLSGWPSLDVIVNMRYGYLGITNYGEYYFDNTIDLGEVYTSRLSSNMLVYGQNFANFMSMWGTLSAVESLDGTKASDWMVQLQVRTTPDDPLAAPVWSDWKNFIIGDYSARAFEFRLLMFSYVTSVSPAVQTLEVSVDMPDRVYGENDVVCGVTGQTVTYSPAFRATPSIAIAAQGLQTGDYYEITSKDRFGFDIIFKDSTNTSVIRTFDYVAKGYGRQT